MMMAQVHVLGPLACDRVYHVDRLPGHDEKAFAKAYRDVVGGPPLWVAAHLAAWGTPVSLHSAVGADEAGRIVMAELDRRGIHTSAIARPEGLRTATPAVIVDRTGERAIVIDALPEAALLKIGHDLAPKPGDWVVSNLFHPEPVREAVSRARSAGAASLIDLELPEVERVGFGRAMEAAGAAEVLCTNAQFLSWWRPHERSDQIATAAMCALALADGRRAVVVTLGAVGAVAVDGGDVFHVPVPPVTAVNTTAAGDTFAAGFVRARLDDASIEAATRAGVAAASRFVAGDPTDWNAVKTTAGGLVSRRLDEIAAP
jgi:sugar/nucleoside kinase (ribokinase family)